ncbi:MAG: DUF4263 domain-containing protein [Verrucomicrobia bacterium]|nr:DUF4263 domain-containing protein [Verrucomicrobiota bacterium]
MYDRWSELEGGTHPVLKNILTRWNQLVHKDGVREQRLHRFLETHAHLFFREYGFATIVTKLRFGADFVSDFVAVHDLRSEGILYTLIEIERADSAPFTKEGHASARLSRAIQQVLSWKTWLVGHPAESAKLFPSLLRRLEHPVFRYQIIIGTRANTDAWTDRRNILAESLGISIRSFDSFADRLKESFVFDDLSDIHNEERLFSPEQRNRLACPFFAALSDGQWRELLGKKPASASFICEYGEKLLQLRRENRFARRFRAGD